MWSSLEQLLQDLRFGCRILTKSPALSATAVILATLVIGGNTTVFSIANGILRKPAPGVLSGGLVRLNWVDEEGRLEAGSSYSNFRDLAAQSSTLAPMLAFRPYLRFTLTHENGSHAVNGNLVSSRFFETLGVRLVKGRTFSEEEFEGRSSGLVLVISHRAWQELFQNAEDVIGRQVLVNRHPATIVGVAAPDFRGTLLAESADVWIPFVSYAVTSEQAASLLNRLEYDVAIIGRLAPHASVAEARAELTAIWERVRVAHPELAHLKVTFVPYSAVAGNGTGLDHQGDRLLAILSIITLLTLIIVCANVANLLLGRAVVRQREMALRQSLGASRVRIIRLLLAEGMVISLIAAGAALLFAWWMSKAASGLIEFVPGVEATLDFTPDWTVAGYAIALAVVAVVAFTVAPAVQTWRLELLSWLKAGEQGVVHGRSRLSSGLVIVQLSLSVLLLTSASLVYRSLFLMGRVEPGFNTRNLLRVTVNTSGSAAGADTNGILLERMRERLLAVRGVDRVTYAHEPLFDDGGWRSARVRSAGLAGRPVEAERNYVGPHFVQALGIPSLIGRDFVADERTRTTRSAFVSRNLADALWPGASALDQRVLLEQEAELAGTGVQPRRVIPSQEVQVIGIIPDGFFSGFRREQRRFIFLAAQQQPASPGETAFYIRHTGRVDAIAPAIGRSLRDVDARAPIVFMRSVDAEHASAIWPVRVMTMILMMFAGASLLIAAIGQYAVVSFDMRRRVREFGLRIALGASPRRMLTSVVQEGLRFTGIGLAIGVVLSLAIGQALGSVLYGVTPTDPVTYGAVFMLLSVASLLACYLPARRAAEIDPIVALRHE